MRSRRGPLPFFLLAVSLGASIPTASHAQISPGEYAARRDTLAAGIDSGVVIAFGGRTPVADFGPFAQLPAFRYLTGYEYADAALVMVVCGGQGTGMLFVHRTAEGGLERITLLPRDIHEVEALTRRVPQP